MHSYSLQARLAMGIYSKGIGAMLGWLRAHGDGRDHHEDGWELRMAGAMLMRPLRATWNLLLYLESIPDLADPQMPGLIFLNSMLLKSNSESQGPLSHHPCCVHIELCTEDDHKGKPLCEKEECHQKGCPRETSLGSFCKLLLFQ